MPYASHRVAVALAAETGRSPLDVLDDFRSFCFAGALSSRPAALPTLPAFARPGHILFGNDRPAPARKRSSPASAAPRPPARWRRDCVTAVAQLGHDRQPPAVPGKLAP
ncbi:hypothetical protein [Streptomyces olivaceoviridis]|uniref:hypothetical protein n=1 Tax=Streptomyces olivaceoviridis TaxID=1921 RepID=UPI0036AAA920